MLAIKYSTSRPPSSRFVAQIFVVQSQYIDWMRVLVKSECFTWLLLSVCNGNRVGGDSEMLYYTIQYLEHLSLVTSDCKREFGTLLPCLRYQAT